MKLSSIIAGAAILAAGAGVVVLEMGKGDATATAEVRAIRIDGECPKPSKEAPKCDSTSQQKGYCLCITKQAAGSVDGEVSSSNIAARPAKDVQRLVVCPSVEVADPKGNKSQSGIRTRWQTKDVRLEDGCLVAADDVVLPNISMNGLETGTEEQLRRFCAPCPISAGSWGRCPRCALEEGGCQKACPPPADVGPK